MRSLLSKLWTDDQGAVVAAELVLILAILVFGIIPGLVALRNATNATLATMGNELLAINVGFSFSGFSILVGGTTIAEVDGAQFIALSPATYFSSGEATSNNVVSGAIGYVTPAP